MKFVKRLPLDRSNPQDDRWAVLQDGRIITDTKVAIRLPVGGDQDRPTINENGDIRYNEDLKEYEVYNGQSPGTGWEKIRTVRPAPITVQNLGDGDYAITVFGPLRYSTNEAYTNYTSPQNILVFVENVYQIPVLNYTLIQTPGNTVSIQFTSPPPNKRVTALLGFDGYFPPFPTP